MSNIYKIYGLIPPLITLQILNFQAGFVFHSYTKTLTAKNENNVTTLITLDKKFSSQSPFASGRL